MNERGELHALMKFTFQGAETVNKQAKKNRWFQIIIRAVMKIEQVIGQRTNA